MCGLMSVTRKPDHSDQWSRTRQQSPCQRGSGRTPERPDRAGRCRAGRCRRTWWDEPPPLWTCDPTSPTKDGEDSSRYSARRSRVPRGEVTRKTRVGRPSSKPRDRCAPATSMGHVRAMAKRICGLLISLPSDAATGEHATLRATAPGELRGFPPVLGVGSGHRRIPGGGDDNTCMPLANASPVRWHRTPHFKWRARRLIGNPIMAIPIISSTSSLSS